MHAIVSLGHLFLPEELLISIALLLGVIGLLLWLAGFRRAGLSIFSAILGLLIFETVASAVIEQVLALMPLWLVIFFAVAVVFYFVRLFLTLFLGAEGAGALMAMAVAGIFARLWRLPALVLKLLRQLTQLLRSSNPYGRVAGIALAIVLTVLAGLVTRKVQQTYWQPSSTLNAAQYPQAAGSPVSTRHTPE